MRTFFNSYSNKKRVMALGLLAGLAVSLASPARSAAQALPCSWPIEVTGHGITNVAYPDTDATYWVMPIDTAIWKTMIVRGEYPQSRFFSFVTYLRDGNATDSIIDAGIAPDPGSTNPFTPGGGSEQQNYTVVIGDDLLGSSNHLKLGSTTLAFVIYRVYVPDQGLNREGGVPLPQVTLVNADGVAQRVRSCRLLEPVEAKRSLALSLDALAPAAKDILSSQPEILSNPGANSCQSNPQIVTFAKNPAGGRFSNPANTYLTAGGLCPQPNKIIVIRGKGAVFPDTHNGSSIFQPAIPGDIQVRYWSMCNNDEQFPFPVVACQPDWATKLDGEGFYTYVVSQDQSTPSWVPPDATWLPWGNPNISNILYFREMLPASDFDLAGDDYQPQGVFCDKDRFVAQGWQGCFAAAGRGGSLRSEATTYLIAE